MSLGVEATGNATMIGNTTDELLNTGNGYGKLNCESVLFITKQDDGVFIYINANASGTMRSLGGISIVRF